MQEVFIICAFYLHLLEETNKISEQVASIGEVGNAAKALVVGLEPTIPVFERA
jgi:hypothetical protein